MSVAESCLAAACCYGPNSRPCMACTGGQALSALMCPHCCPILNAQLRLPAPDPAPLVSVGDQSTGKIVATARLR